MNCERCHGKGRLVHKATFWKGGKEFAELDEIGPCPDCGGSGQAYCCEGDRAETMLLCLDITDDSGNVIYEVNPNEAG